MPWSQTSPMDHRTQFIADYLRAGNFYFRSALILGYGQNKDWVNVSSV